MITVDFQSLALAHGSTILDIGCGSGRHTAAAYDLDNGMVVGADTNLTDLGQARAKLKWHQNFRHHAKGRWTLAGADITRLPFRDNGFDAVICAEVLEHIRAQGRAAKEIIRILRPGGHLVISVPRRWPETVCWALSRRYRTTPGGHLRIYSARSLVQCIETEGMVHWRTHYAHSLHAPFWWLKCLVGLEREQFPPVVWYHRFLTWDLMTAPRATRLVEAALNPIMGKSVVLYFRKPGGLNQPRCEHSKRSKPIPISTPR